MINFRDIAARVSALDAAEAYGLRIYRSRRALCPWHDDTHPDLAFYGDGRCYCHACHAGGDSIDLTARLFSLTNRGAAEKLIRDFHLDGASSMSAPRASPAMHRRQKAEEVMRDWDIQCEISRCMDQVLDGYTDESAWDDPTFVRALQLRSGAEARISEMWETYTELTRKDAKT